MEIVKPLFSFRLQKVMAPSSRRQKVSPAHTGGKEPVPKIVIPIIVMYGLPLSAKSVPIPPVRHAFIVALVELIYPN